MSKIFTEAPLVIFASYGLWINKNEQQQQKKSNADQIVNKMVWNVTCEFWGVKYSQRYIKKYFS